MEDNRQGTTTRKGRRHRANEALAHLMQSFLRLVLSRQVLERVIRSEIERNNKWEELLQKIRQAEQVRLRLEFDKETAFRTELLMIELEALRRANETKAESQCSLLSEAALICLGYGGRGHALSSSSFRL